MGRYFKNRHSDQLGSVDKRVAWAAAFSQFGSDSQAIGVSQSLLAAATAVVRYCLGVQNCVGDSGTIIGVEGVLASRLAT